MVEMGSEWKELPSSSPSKRLYSSLVNRDVRFTSKVRVMAEAAEGAARVAAAKAPSAQVRSRIAPSLGQPLTLPPSLLPATPFPSKASPSRGDAAGEALRSQAPNGH